MNKYLMMSAAALMASAGSAAISTSAHADSWLIGSGDPCQAWAGVATSDSITYTDKDLTSGEFTTGIAGKNKNFNAKYGGGKKFVYFGFSGTSFAYGYEIQLPIASGNHWTGFATSNATSMWEYNSGTYCVSGAHAAKMSGAGKK